VSSEFRVPGSEGNTIHADETYRGGERERGGAGEGKSETEKRGMGEREKIWYRRVGVSAYPPSLTPFDQLWRTSRDAGDE
jgi:hypothetical protein